MNKSLSFAIIFMAISTATIAQGNKSVFLEFGGNGLGLSANFDSRFSKAENGFGFRVGLGLIPGLDAGIVATSTFLTIPVGVNYLAGKGPHYFEAGAGATFISGSVSVLGDNAHGSGVAFVPSLGYRYAKLGKGFQFRAVISPLVGSGGAYFWGGFSVGVKF